MLNSLLLRAIRFNTRQSWSLYTIAITSGLYIHLLSIFVTIGHGIYLGILERFKASKKLVAFGISCLIAALAFIPWLIILRINLDNAQQAISWLQKKSSIINSLSSFFHNISNSLIDFWYVYTYFPDLDIPNLRLGQYLKPFLLALIIYSIYFICRKTSIKTWLFVLTLITTLPILIILNDLISQSGGLSIARFVIPCYLGIQISLAYLFAKKLSNVYFKRWKMIMWQTLAFLLIFGGILSCGISSQAETWLNKYGNNQYPAARIINQSANPLVISDSMLILSLSHRLDSDVNVLLKKDPDIKQLSKNYSDTFVFNPSSKLRKTIKDQSNYQIIPTSGVDKLWQVVPQK